MTITLFSKFYYYLVNDNKYYVYDSKTKREQFFGFWHPIQIGEENTKFKPNNFVDT